MELPISNRKTRILALIPGDGRGQGFIFARRQVEQLIELGMEVREFFLDTRTRPLLLFRRAIQFLAVSREFDPDVVHAHYGTVLALFSVILSRKPVVISFKGTDLNPSSEFSYLRGAVSRLFSQIAAMFADKIICVSNELQDAIWCPDNKVEVILDGVNQKEFFPIDRNLARAKLGWPESDKIILFNAGRGYLPNKGCKLVEEAVSILKRDERSVKLIMMQGDITRDLVPLYINSADVVVMASQFEGSPNIVKEALACNVPVCSVVVGDVAQLLDGVINCVLVTRDPNDLAAGLHRLIKTPLRSNGTAYSYRYSSELFTQRIFDVLQRVSARTTSL